MRIILCLLLLVNSTAYGECTLMHGVKELLAKDKHKNYLKFNVNNWFYAELTQRSHMLPALYPGFTVSEWGQLGVGYERQVTRRISVETSYSRWKYILFFANPDHYRGNIYIVLSNDFPDKPGLYYRFSAQFYDLNVSYIIIARKKHRLKAGLALSLEKGYNGYIDSVHFYNGGPFKHFQAYGHNERHDYWGYVPSLSYDYNFLKQWLAVGVDVKVRRYPYFGKFTQVDAGIHLGVNF